MDVAAALGLPATHALAHVCVRLAALRGSPGAVLPITDKLAPCGARSSGSGDGSERCRNAPQADVIESAVPAEKVSVSSEVPVPWAMEVSMPMEEVIGWPRCRRRRSV